MNKTNKDGESKQKPNKFQGPCPYIKANWLSTCVFWWMTPLFIYGYKHPITQDHLYDVLPEDESSKLTDRLESQWNKELQKSSSKGKKPVLFRATLMTFSREILFNGIFLVISETVRVVQPYLVGQLVSYFQPGSTISPTEVYIIVVIMSTSSLIQLLVNPKYFFNTHHIGVKMKVALGGLVYRKLLKISSLSLHRTTSGKIINHLSTDLQLCVYATESFHFSWIAPIEICLSLYLIYRGIGSTCFFALAVIGGILPLQFLCGRISGKLRLKIGAKADKRVHMMNQIIAGMRVIKMYCWEKPFSDLITEMRRQELIVQWRACIFKALNIAIYLGASKLTCMVIFTTAWVYGVPMSARLVYSTIGWIECLRLTVFLFLYFFIEDNTQLYSSLKRVQTFLELEDVQSQESQVENGGPAYIKSSKTDQSDYAIQLVSMTAIWKNHAPKSSIVANDGIQETSKLVASESQEMTENFGLKDIDLNIKPGELVAVVGPVGAGKSSLLLALLNELPVTEGQILLNGTMGYASQESWVVSGTLQENILFGLELEQARYQKIINVCALQKDIENMSNGDQTLVGERGLLLSGGQKARLNLARTIYRDSNIYLLDDPLSAVDTKVGHHLFNKCICGYLAGKTRILVTHQLQYLRTADKIVVLKEGRIINIGTFEEIQKNGTELSTLLHVDEKENDGPKVTIESEGVICEELPESEQEIQVEEETQKGSVNWRVYLEYVMSGRPSVHVTLIIMFLLALDLSMLYGDWHLAKWAESQQKLYLNTSPKTADVITNTTMMYSMISNSSGDQSITSVARVPGYSFSSSPPAVTMTYLNNTLRPTADITRTDGRYGYRVTDLYSQENGSSFTNSTENITDLSDRSIRKYIVSICVFVICAVGIGVVHFRTCVTVSRNLHNKMFKCVVGARTRFFDSNPVGRILNRFAKDVGLMDELIPRLLYAIYEIGFRLLSYCIMTCIINPWLIIPLLPLATFVFLIRQYAVPTTRNIKRVEALTQSPIYSHVSDTLIGLQSIRALGMTARFANEFDRYQNKHTIANFMYLSAFRWFSLRSLFAVVIYLNLVIFLSLFFKDGIGLTGALYGLALNYILLLADPFEFFMRLTAEIETNMTSVERITSYTRLEQEAPKTSDKTPAAKWPQKGEITLKNLSLSYTTGSPLVLKSLSCVIKNNEKIGIVGRTGAGKSSLLAALLRLAEPKGELNIDGVDVLKIGLHELRSKISVIPQDPMLFSGTLRKNLDPFEEYTDDQLWNALEQVKLKDKVETCKGQLYMEVSESGQNFSVGQRQLVCLARAIMRYNKILVLDEATANVDNKTDELIQTTIRKTFCDCTVLTVAHRLHTVMDSDRVMVLDQGELKEFDSPYKLLQMKDGYFRSLCDQTGESQSAYLQSLALAAEQNKGQTSTQNCDT